MERIAVLMKTCTLCGEGFEIGRISRATCKTCGSVHARLYYLFKTNDLKQSKAEDELRQWHSLTTKQRQAFYSHWYGELELHRKRKSELSDALVEFIKVSKYESSTKSWKWLADFQLRERYKGREEQVEHIQKNAESMECKVRGVMLWADAEYTSNEMEGNQSNRERERELSARSISSPQKRPKADPAPKAEPQKLSRTQLQTLARDKRKLRELLKKVKLTNHKANLPELVEEITKRDRESLRISECKLTSMIATVQKFMQCTDSGSGAYKDLQKRFYATWKEVKFYHKKLLKCVADAEKHITLEVMAIIEEKMQAAEKPAG